MGMRASSARLSNPSAFLISLIFPPPPPNLSHLLLLLTPPDSTRGEVEGGEGGRGGGLRAALWLCPIVEDAAPHCCRRLRRIEKRWQRCCWWGLLQVSAFLGSGEMR